VRVAALYVYPVKGGAAVPVAEIALDALGPVGDRRFCLARPGGRVFTQRDDASLARLRATPGARAVVLDFDGKSLEVPFDTFIRSATLQVWNRKAEVRTAGDDVNDALTRWFGTPLELARLEGAALALVDAAALLLANAASLDALNAALPAPVPMARFRPNVVIAGAGAYDEDGWPQLEIGDALLSPAHACGRCEVTTIDQELGAARGPEPLRTLARLRERGGEPVFGVYFAVERPGRIRVGDAARPAG
jgi:uncharacterized protein YcbX